MLRLILKLVLAGVLAHVVWRAGSAYLTFYRFKDAVTETAQYGGVKSTEEVEARVLELASQYGVPLADGRLSVRRTPADRTDLGHTYVDGTYTQGVDVLPGYRYPWQFTFHIDVLTTGRASLAPVR